MLASTISPGPQARELAARLGLHRSGREWRGTCPLCSYPGDPFSLTETGGRMLAWCAACQDRAGIGALLRGAGALPDRPNPARAAEGERDRRAKAERARDRALALWRGAEPVPGTPAATYLHARGIGGIATSSALLFRGDTPHPAGGRLPALLALVTAPDGMQAGIHRTYLRRDGAGKADVTPAKAALGPIWAGAIRLVEASTALVVGEGIETAAAAGLLVGLPAWAAISAGNLARALVLPEVVQDVTIAVDRDAPGEAAACAAAARWRAEGRGVRFLVPDRAGTDAADLVEVRHG